MNIIMNVMNVLNRIRKYTISLRIIAVQPGKGGTVSVVKVKRSIACEASTCAIYYLRYAVVNIMNS